ncbi:MAG: TIM-barrel domain-containing protein [Candidatus Dormibacteria bacterium]
MADTTDVLERLRTGEEMVLAPRSAISIPHRNTLQGFGVHFAPFRAGDAWRLRVRDSPVGLMSYAPSQSFRIEGLEMRITSQGDELVEFDPVDSPGYVRLTAAREGILHATAREEAYAAPDWASALWLGGSWNGLTERSVLEDLKEQVEHRVHLTVRLIDFGWQSEEELFAFHPIRFPNAAEMLRSLHDAGMRVVVWWAPWIDAATPLWKLMEEQGWLLGARRGEALRMHVVGDGEVVGSYIDITNASCLKYMRERLQALLELGIDGIRLDFGEALTDEIVFAGEVLPDALVRDKLQVSRNSYIVAVQSFFRHSLLEGNPEALLVSRAGWTHSPQESGLWLGDQSSDVSRYSGLKSAVYGAKTAFETGYRCVGLDIGGYWDEPTQETYGWWHEIACAMPFATYHGFGKRAPWEYGHPGLEAHARCARIRSDIAGVGPQEEIHIVLGRTNDNTLIRQASSRNWVVPLPMGQPISVVLPEGNWKDTVTDIHLEGPMEIGCTPNEGMTVYVRDDASISPR